ncbi:MAG: sugar-binding domain-containing protein [Geminicoccaceae bacterium]
MRYLLGVLERPEVGILGVGHGRTLAAVVDRLPRLPRADLKFVSLLGSLTRNAAANPFDVIHRLAEKVGGESYFLPVPFFADSIEDKAVLMAQRSVRTCSRSPASPTSSSSASASSPADAHLLQTGMITQAEFAALAKAGAVGEVLGHFFAADGRSVAAEINGRALGLGPDDLRGKEVTAIAGGRGKARAIHAVLQSGLLTGLVTDEATARRLAELDRGRPPGIGAGTGSPTALLRTAS